MSDAIIPADAGAFAAIEKLDTGLVTAAVTAGEPVKLTSEGKEAAKGLLNLKDVAFPILAALARDLAQDIIPLPVLLNKHGLTQNQYDFLAENNEFFKNTLAQECRDWQSISSTEKRLRLQALAALEDKLPTLANRMGSAAEKLGDVVEAAKFFARVAAVDAPANGGAAGGSGFTISIDLGADTRITIGDTSGGAPAADQSGAGPVPKVIEATANPGSLQQKPER